MTKPSAGRRGGSTVAKEPQAGMLLAGWVGNPYLAFLLLLGVGVATLRLEHHLRLIVLWLLLLSVVLLRAESGHIQGRFSLLNLARGGLVGIIVALPFYLLAKGFFQSTAVRLYAVEDWHLLLERAVFLVPILEGCFFRGIVQGRRGPLDGALLFGLTQALYVIPTVGVFPAVVISVALGMFLFGLLYGYLHQRYGLTASISCQAAVNFVLFVLPTLGATVSKLMAF